MKTTQSKRISQISSTIRKFLSLTAVAAFVTVPLLGAVATSEAAPKRQKSSKASKKNQRYTPKKKPSNRYPNNHRNQRPNSRNNRSNDNRYNNNRPNNNRYNRVQTFQGPVTKIKGNRDFDIRDKGRIYNVTSSSSLPRNLRRNDQVRVQGVRSGNNDIVNARVTIVRRY